jgi:hypothetical protein
MHTEMNDVSFVATLFDDEGNAWTRPYTDEERGAVLDRINAEQDNLEDLKVAAAGAIEVNDTIPATLQPIKDYMEGLMANPATDAPISVILDVLRQFANAIDTLANVQLTETAYQTGIIRVVLGIAEEESQA